MNSYDLLGDTVDLETFTEHNSISIDCVAGKEKVLIKFIASINWIL